MITNFLGAFLDELWTEVRKLFEIRILLPHGLRHHLCQFHSGKTWRQVSLAAEHIDTGLDQANRLAKDFLGVGLELGRELHPRHVSLQQEVGLDVWVVVL